MDDGLQDTAHNSIEPPRRSTGLDVNQWVVLAVLGGLLLAIGATLILVLFSGIVRPVSLASPVLTPEPGSMPRVLAVENKARALDLYWPAKAPLLAPPDAPGNRIWWDTRFAYRRALLLDDIARRAPAGQAAEVLWDGAAAVRAGLARADGADVRIVYWDGQWWHDLERTIGSGARGAGWRISFALVGEYDGVGRYHLYYGYPGAAGVDDLLPSERDEHQQALVLSLGPQEAVEWGPTVTWKAHSTATQTLVSPDGRLVFEHPAGSLSQDTRVRLRIVPVSERSGFGPLPDYEFHADPPPGASTEGRIVQWDPPVTVSINWAGLPGKTLSPTWTHFRYDSTAATWEAVPIELDIERGILRFTTDQP